ncbi:MAG: lysophospholipid acyltransferase family protein [Nitrospirae bacterium]|nr:lysophospholipid acyltransferase family protein [Nitrospirota bacterium]NTW64836.1 lysophospholipid acyltransferase family protein [Nitrospirota bacterium]
MARLHQLPTWHPAYWPTWIGLGIMRLLSLLPLPAIWLLGSTLGAFLHLFPSKIRTVTRINVSLCLPELGKAGQRKLVRRHFRALGVSMLCYGFAWWSSPARLRRLVMFRDRQLYDNAIASGRAIILMTPHFLSLDVGGICLSSERPMITMYRSSRNKLVDAMLKKRARFGAVLFERKSNLKALIRHLREQRPFYYLPDQDSGGAEGVFVPFFGVPAATVTALSRIAKMTNAVVIPCYNRILPWGRGFEVCFEEPLSGFPSDDPEKDARRMNEEVERAVRQNPEQYLWGYRRFKTRPEGSPPVY